MAALTQNLKKTLLKLNSGTLLVIEIDKGQLKQVKGKPNMRFLNDCGDVARENNLKSGLIYVVKNGDGGTRVRSSGPIPDFVAQRLRNTWSFYS